MITKINTTMLMALVLVLPGCGKDTTAADTQPVADQTVQGAAVLPAAPVAVNSKNALEEILSQVTVYKSPTCGCCAAWVTYLEEEGFAVNAINHDNVNEIKTANGLHNDNLKSCHTALVDGYVIEGHVPADDIKRLLREKPMNVKGLTAPGMPQLSPGMNSRTPKGLYGAFF